LPAGFSRAVKHLAHPFVAHVTLEGFASFLHHDAEGVFAGERNRRSKRVTSVH